MQTNSDQTQDIYTLSCLVSCILFTHYGSPEWLPENKKHNGSPCAFSNYCKRGIFKWGICGVFFIDLEKAYDTRHGVISNR